MNESKKEKVPTLPDRRLAHLLPASVHGCAQCVLYCSTCPAQSENNPLVPLAWPFISCAPRGQGFLTGQGLIAPLSNTVSILSCFTFLSCQQFQQNSNIGLLSQLSIFIAGSPYLCLS
jgi:hypothetical protein